MKCNKYGGLPCPIFNARTEVVVIASNCNPECPFQNRSSYSHARSVKTSELSPPSGFQYFVTTNKVRTQQELQRWQDTADFFSRRRRKNQPPYGSQTWTPNESL